MSGDSEMMTPEPQKSDNRENHWLDVCRYDNAQLMESATCVNSPPFRRGTAAVRLELEDRQVKISLAAEQSAEKIARISGYP